jgi:hypothetical protein
MPDRGSLGGSQKCALSVLAMASCSGHRVGYHKMPQRQYRELLGEPVAARCVGEPWSYHLQGSLCDGHQARARGWGAAWQDGCPRCADRGCEVRPTTEDTLATTWHCCCDSDHKNARPGRLPKLRRSGDAFSHLAEKGGSRSNLLRRPLSLRCTVPDLLYFNP